MVSASWVGLFRQIPANLHDVLVIITATGTEIMIQKILIMEGDYLIFRGRLSGVQDGGMVMIMPYDQISSISFNKRMLEPEVFQIFGENSKYIPTVAAIAAAPAAESKDQAEDADTAPETVADLNNADAAPESEEPAAPAGKPAQPSKSTLLARLRSRLSGQAKT